MNLSAVILAGGESRRMGRDKAWIELDGEPLISLAVKKVRQLGVREVFISGRAGEDYSALKCPVLVDLEPNFGPLGGIERALFTCESPLLLVLAVDLPRMTTAFLETLVARCDRLTGTVPKVNGGIEALAAVYPKRCHAVAFDLIVKCRHAAREFAESCLREHAVCIFPVPPAQAGNFTNWNNPHDILATRDI
jgi:molybdenum cofactor guanylyltransferase